MPKLVFSAKISRNYQCRCPSAPLCCHFWSRLVPRIASKAPLVNSDFAVNIKVEKPFTITDSCVSTFSIIKKHVHTSNLKKVTEQLALNVPCNCTFAVIWRKAPKPPLRYTILPVFSSVPPEFHDLKVYFKVT